MARGDLSAVVLLRDVEGVDSIPERIVVLSEPSWQIKIGRGTMSGDEGLRPMQDNTWFDSRVMSRNHAILRANPDTKEFTIEDVGSMHGTQRNGRRLKANTPENLYDRDTLVFGADVTRGSSSFRALKVLVSASWSNDTAFSFPDSVTTYRNTFTADYSEEDMYDEDADDDDAIYDENTDVHAVYDEFNGGRLRDDVPPGNWENYYEVEPEDDPDDDVEIVKESIRAPSVEVIIPPRSFSVPDSDISDASSDGSDGEVAESPTSSPIGPSDDGSKKEDLSQIRNSFAVRVDRVDSRSPADVIYSESAISTSLRLEDEVDYSEPEHDEDSEEEDDNDDDDDIEDRGALAETVSSVNLHIHSEGVVPGHNNKCDVEARAPEAVRTPSPSDAAMVKPASEFMAMAPPFLPNIAGYDHTRNLCMPGRDPAWAGHNSVLYDPVVRPLPEYPTAYNAGYAFQNQYALDSPPLTYPAIPSPYTASFACGPPALPPSNSKPSSKCSIAEILDQSKTNTDESGAPASRFLKRKADEMSDVAAQTPLDISSSPDVCSEEKSEKASAKIGQNISESKLRSRETPSTTVVAELAIKDLSKDDAAPPRKKVKVNDERGNQGGGFMKMAAATIAGVAIGTVGTIIGLASLPQDYFL